MFKLVIVLFFIGTAWFFEYQHPDETWNADTPLQNVLLALGEETPKHYLAQPHQELIWRGEEIVKLGRTQSLGGKKTRYISKHYVCTTCHNLEQEDPDLRFSNPETRLGYVKEKGIPFLQGTTFKGIVNRETWYNDDYVNKYGDEKIRIAHDDLKESIQLCAIECSQGRPMEHWEIDAVLAYFWTLQFKLSDLDLSPADIQQLNTKPTTPETQQAQLKWLKSFYLQKSPATFFDAPKDKREGYPALSPGNPAIGKDLYELSCLHCHKPNGVSHYILDDSKLSFRHLKKMVPKNSHFSLYQIIAYGTYSLPGHRPYMPHYPEERMNKQQIEDLRSYVELRSK